MWNFSPGVSPDFRGNFGFLGKFRIFGEISDFWGNFGFSGKFRIFGEISDKDEEEDDKEEEEENDDDTIPSLHCCVGHTA